MKGSRVAKVELSFDQGQSWKQAEIWAKEGSKDEGAKVFSWSLWKYTLPVD